MSERERDIFDDLDALKVGRPDVERAPMAGVFRPIAPALAAAYP
jgi:hypothetical protein